MFCSHLHHLPHTEVLHSKEREPGCNNVAPELPEISGQGCLPWGHQQIPDRRGSCWQRPQRPALLPRSSWTKPHCSPRCKTYSPNSITFELLRRLAIPQSSQGLTHFCLRILMGLFHSQAEVPLESLLTSASPAFFSWKALSTAQIGLVPALLLMQLPLSPL